MRTARLRGRPAVWVASTLTIVLGLLPLATSGAGAQQVSAQRTFAETGYTIHWEPFWTYFQERGGVRTFGYPTSNALPFMGCVSQFFQRHVMQQCGEGQPVQLLNLLDEGLLPYTRLNGSTFPGIDPAVVAQAPGLDDPAYSERVVELVRRTASNTWEGEPVSFFDTFMGTVRVADAFPRGGGNPALLPLLNLEIWGLPTSLPARDPNNPDFIYQRFQRGIMHYDKSTGQTQGLLLGEYLKALITEQGLPGDLGEQARSNPLKGSAVSGRLPPGTNYVGAFTGVEARTVPLPLPSPTAVPTPGPELPVWTRGPYRIQAQAGLHRAFATLGGTSFEWVLRRLTQESIRVFYVESGTFWGAYVPSQRLLAVNAELAGAAPQTVGALLVHEASHVTDYLAGKLSSFNECVSSERVAAEQEARYWLDIYGSSGKPTPSHAFERQLNALAVVRTRNPEKFEDFLAEVYTPQCSRFNR